MEKRDNIPCEFAESEICPVFRIEGECYEDRHHLFYPRSNYENPLERRFRGLGENLVRICRNLHNLEHHVLPEPDKPSREVMKEAIAREKQRRKKG